MEWAGQPIGKRNYGRVMEEYIADFCLVSRRALDPADHRLFRYHYLLGANYKLCCRYLKMDSGKFFHDVYRIEQTLGRVFRELKPYGLFPLDEYFGGVVRKNSVRTRVLQILRGSRLGSPRSILQKIA